MSKVTMWIVMAVVALAAAAAVTAAPAAPAPAPEIDHPTEQLAKKMMAILYDKRSLDEDGYSFEVETADGQYRQEVGMILNRGTKDETKVVMGQYAYKDAFGKKKHYVYVADKNGYRVMQAKDKDKENLRKAHISLLG